MIENIPYLYTSHFYPLKDRLAALLEFCKSKNFHADTGPDSFQGSESQWTNPVEPRAP